MTSKELKHMGREELLQLLIERTKEVERLNAQLSEKEEQILQLQRTPAAETMPTVQEPGSIAQAALQINHVFEDAQKAADQYLTTIARMQREQALRCQQLLQDAHKEADRLIEEAQMRASAMEAETARQCEELRQIAQQAAQHNWSDLSSRLDRLYDTNAELRELLASAHKKRNWHR